MLQMGNRKPARMDQVRERIVHLFKYKKAQAYGIPITEIHRKLVATLPFPIRQDYLKLAIVGKRGPYMFDADMQRVYWIGGEGDGSGDARQDA